MATDYYPVIARAIDGLGPGAPGRSRGMIYERARSALIVQLRSVTPPLLETEIAREQQSLEEAMHEVEAEAALRARDDSRTGEKPLSRKLFDRVRAIVERPKISDVKVLQNESDTLAELSRLIGQSDLFGSKTVHDDLNRANVLTGRSVSLPPITVIPEQNAKKAIAFRPSRRGPLDLLADPPKDSLDPEQVQLYTRIRSQLTKIKDEIPSQERAQVDDVLNDFLGSVEIHLEWMTAVAR